MLLRSKVSEWILNDQCLGLPSLWLLWRTIFYHFCVQTMSIFSSVVLLSKCEMPLIPFVWLSVSGEVMKLSTNHAHEKTTWLEALQTPGQSPKLRQHSEKSGVTSPSPWVERHPVSLSERTFSKSSPPRSDSFGSPPNSATPKGSLSTSGVHSQVKVQVSTNGWVCSYKCTNLVFFFFFHVIVLQRWVKVTFSLSIAFCCYWSDNLQFSSTQSSQKGTLGFHKAQAHSTTSASIRSDC